MQCIEAETVQHYFEESIQAAVNGNLSEDLVWGPSVSWEF